MPPALSDGNAAPASPSAGIRQTQTVMQKEQTGGATTKSVEQSGDVPGIAGINKVTEGLNLRMPQTNAYEDRRTYSLPQEQRFSHQQEKPSAGTQTEQQEQPKQTEQPQQMGYAELFKAVQIGGPSGGTLTEKDLDLPLDFDSVKKAGAMIGSGGLVVMNDKTCMVEVARFFMNFTQNESCGKCVPCREGTRRMLEILERIVAGNGEPGDIDLLLELAETISATALCGLGKSAASPVVSTIKNFRDEYEAHINEKRCPAGVCQKLKRIEIQPDKCKGCSKCSRGCPVGAISGVIKSPFVIDQSKCIKCGACVTTCPFHAIEVK